MKLIEKNENQIVFSSEMSETLANSIRRYLNRILVMAVDELEISKNDSPLYDETVAHRVGLVPLKSDKSTTNEKSKGKLTLKLKRKGVVYSGDMSGNPEPVQAKIPLTTLDDGQEIDFTATVKAGRGIEHSKFSPGIMFYREIVELALDKEFYDEVKKVCSNEIKEKGQKMVIIDNQKKEIADVCEGIAEKKGKKAEVTKKGELVVTLESFGQVSSKDVFLNSVDALKKDLKEISKQVKKI